MKAQNVSSTPMVNEIKTATDALDAQRESMRFLLPATAAERSQRKRFASQALRNTEKRLEAARQHRNSLPASFDFASFERDVGIMLELERCLDSATRICAELHDTLSVVGARGIQAAAAAYAHIKAESQGAPAVKRTVEGLLKRRPRAKAKDAAIAAPTPAPVPGAGATASATAPQGQPTPTPTTKAA